MSVSIASLSDINGQQFGRLKAVSYAGGDGVRMWHFECSCGVKRVIPLFKVRCGDIRDCGGKVHQAEPAQDPELDPFLAQHGGYEREPVISRGGLVEFSLSHATINRAPTYIDGWLDEEDDFFARRHVRVIARCREFWSDLGVPRHPLFDRGEDDVWAGLDEDRAFCMLRRCAAAVPLWQWRIFENVCRWNEPIGVPGAKVAHYSEGSVLAAKATVRDVAEAIATKGIL